MVDEIVGGARETPDSAESGVSGRRLTPQFVVQGVRK